MTRYHRRLVPWTIALTAASLVSCTADARVGVTSRAELVSGAAVAVQSVLPGDRGTLYASAANGENALLGISLNDPHSVHWAQMSEAAVKVSHGMVSAIRPNGEDQWPWFPYSALVQYEQEEVAAGRPPLRLTATYQGESRPVYYNWSLGFPALGEPPRVTDPNAWEQALNIGDERYVPWLLANYVDPIMLQQYYTPDGQPIDVDDPYPNEWLGVDQVALNYHLYGVLDDAGNWVPMDAGPLMDRPFPETSDALHAMYRSFFARLHQVRPDLRIMANLGSPDTWATFAEDFADVDGLVLEEIFAGNSPGRSTAEPEILRDVWSNVAAFAAEGRVALLRSLLDPASPDYETDLRSGLMAYLVLSGENTAWAPQGTVQDELAPGAYQAMKDALGPATGSVEVREEGSPGAALYVRTTVNGVVHVNMTGRDVSVSCPAGATCRDRAGNTVASITVPNRTGDYLLTAG